MLLAKRTLFILVVIVLIAAGVFSTKSTRSVRNKTTDSRLKANGEVLLSQIHVIYQLSNYLVEIYADEVSLQKGNMLFFKTALLWERKIRNMRISIYDKQGTRLLTAVKPGTLITRSLDVLVVNNPNIKPPKYRWIQSIVIDKKHAHVWLVGSNRKILLN